MSSIITHPSFLRYALLGDALASGATGVLMALGAAFLAPWLGLPDALLRGAGFILIPYAIVVAWLAGRPTKGEISGGPVVAVIVINILWAIDSVAVLVGPWVAPTRLGIAFVAFQALVVLGFAVAQYLGLRARSAVPAFAWGAGR